MADEQNELEVLEARREILQLEIALARERRAALEAEQKAKKTADNGGEPTLDYVVPSKYPDARHAESLPTAGILRRGKPTLLPLPTNPVLQHLEAEAVKQGHASSHNAWIFRSIVSVSAYLELGVLSLQQETDDTIEDLAAYVEEELVSDAEAIYKAQRRHVCLQHLSDRVGSSLRRSVHRHARPGDGEHENDE